MTYPHDDNGRGRGSYPDDRNARGNRGGPPNGYDDRGAPSDRGAPAGREPEDDGPLMAEGEYPCVAVSHKWGYTSKDGEQVGVRVKFVDGPYKGRSLTWYGYFTDAAEDIAMRGLRALGFKGDNILDMSSMYLADNTPAIAVVQHDEYNGKTRARIAFLNGSDVAMKSEMNANELNAFAQRMRAKFARHGGGGNAPAPAQGGSRGAAPRDNGGRQGNLEDQRRGGYVEQRMSGNDDPPWDNDPGQVGGGGRRGR